MVVLDASAVVAVLLDPGSRAEHVRQRIESPGNSLHVPHFMDLEVFHALRWQKFCGVLPPRRSIVALKDLSNIMFVRYPHASIMQRIWELREIVTTYDAAYVALAEALEALLVTMDARLARAPGIRAAVELY